MEPSSSRQRILIWVMLVVAEETDVTDLSALADEHSRGRGYDDC